MEIINFYCAKHYILDVMKKPKLSLKEGIESTYDWYLKNEKGND